MWSDKTISPRVPVATLSITRFGLLESAWNTSWGIGMKNLYVMGALILFPVALFVTARKTGITSHLVGEAGPKLSAAETALDLGRGKIGQTLTGQIQFRNVGGSPLTFKIEPSCACTVIDPINGAVAPGGLQSVRVALKINEADTQKTVGLEMETNDASVPTMRWKLKAANASVSPMSPREINFGEVSRGEIASRTLYINLPTGTGATARDSVALEAAGAEIGIVATEDDEGAGRLAYRVSLDTHGLASNYYSTIRCRIPDMDVDQEVPVRVNIIERDGFTVAPTTLFRISGTASAPSGAAYAFVVRNDGKPLGNPLKIEHPESVRVIFEATSSPSRGRVKITDAAPGDASSADSSIRIYFSDSSEPATIKIVWR